MLAAGCPFRLVARNQDVHARTVAQNRPNIFQHAPGNGQPPENPALMFESVKFFEAIG
jgi:hypothetical protein